ncbi:MAG: hypothetical protein HYY40_05285 [Bacteroidetes bacterium]|nr:hypothetical protein [Bacteroidota bacterium]
MIRFYVGEKWKKFSLGFRSKFRYAVSNYGRLMSFTEKYKDGNLLSGGDIDGYKLLNFRIYKRKKSEYRHLFFHHLVAKNFLHKKSRLQRFVLHLDHDKSNNAKDNLKWATKSEMIEHNKKSPAVIAALKKFIKANKQRGGHKLTVAKVRVIKKMILNPKRRTPYKIIAKRFGVTEMTLHRIKTGENWKYVK